MYRKLSSMTHAYGAMEIMQAEHDSEGSSGPVSFADLGIPQPTKLRDTLLGKARQFKDIKRNEQVFIITSLITLAVTCVFTVYRICTLNRTSDPDFTFAIVLLVNALFCAYYVVHGVLQERATEILIFSIATGAVLIYLIVNYAAGKKDNVKLGRLIVACVLAPIMVGMGLWLSVGYHSSGELIFRTVGANTLLQWACKVLFLFFDLLKFDLQLGISMVILIVVSADIRTDTVDIVVLSVGSVVSVSWFLIGYFSMKWENKIGAIVFFILSPLEFGYVIFKLVQVADYLSIHKGVGGSTIACGILALVVRIFVIGVTVFVVRNFNQGLKEKAFETPSSTTPQKQVQQSTEP